PAIDVTVSAPATRPPEESDQRSCGVLVHARLDGEVKYLLELLLSRSPREHVRVGDVRPGIDLGLHVAELDGAVRPLDRTLAVLEMLVEVREVGVGKRELVSCIRRRLENRDRFTPDGHGLIRASDVPK